MSLNVNNELVIYKNIDLEELVKLIDWNVYLLTWDFRTDEAKASDGAKELLKDSKTLLDKIIEKNLLCADGVVKIFPAATKDYDDILLYSDINREKVERVLPMLRRQMPMLGKCPSLADFIIPAGEKSEDPGVDDHMGFFAVSAGRKVDELIKTFPEHDVYSPLLVQSLADRLAEASAEYLHKKVRRELWAYEQSEDLTLDLILREKYQGIRPAPGYPCCPDHTGKRDIFEILEVEKNIGISLTESYMMQPAASVCGYLFGSKRSRYFPIGKIGEDQMESYSMRKEIPLVELKRWLSVNVND